MYIVLLQNMRTRWRTLKMKIFGKGRGSVHVFYVPIENKDTRVYYWWKPRNITSARLTKTTRPNDERNSLAMVVCNSCVCNTVLSQMSHKITKQLRRFVPPKEKQKQRSRGVKLSYGCEWEGPQRFFASDWRKVSVRPLDRFTVLFPLGSTNSKMVPRQLSLVPFLGHSPGSLGSRNERRDKEKKRKSRVWGKEI